MSSNTIAVEATPRGGEPTGSGQDCVSLTFVTCIEAGSLEPMVVRMVESLRRWGGRFRNCPVIALNPRFGPPLSRATRKAFERLEISTRRIYPENPYFWMDFYNKPLAVVVAEQEATTDTVAFIDGDILVLGEPEELILGPEEDFAAAAPTKTVGTCGPGDVNEPYWQAACDAVGIRLDDLPWVTTHEEKLRIRAYWNSGLFVYRRASRYGHEYQELCARLIESRVISHASRSFFTEQVSSSLAMVKAGLRWRALSRSQNFNVLGPLLDQVEPEHLHTARILHYHDALWPRFWPEVLSLFRKARPDLHDWIASLGPLSNPLPAHWKAMNRALRYTRRRKFAAFEATCRPY